MKVTMQDVADEAGVHRSTVSLALSANPKIPKETRERILKIARSMGYRPDPLVSSLMKQRRTRGDSEKKAALAFVTTWSSPDEWRKVSKSYQLLFLAARARAEELGYSLESFWLHPPESTPEAFERIMVARGIRGLVLAPAPRRESPDQEVSAPKLNWSRYAVVAIGHTFSSPRLHRVSHDYFASMSLAMAQIVDMGLKRPVLVLASGVERVVDHAWHAAYMLHFVKRLGNPPLKPVSYRRYSVDLGEEIESQAPDAIICLHAGQFSRSLEQAKVQLDPQIPLFSLDYRPSDGDGGGVRPRWRKLGALAVETVVGQIQLGEYGIPSVPRTTSIQGSWVKPNV